MGRCILRNIVDIIGDAVEDLGKTIEVNSVVKVGNVYTFAVNKTYWARPNSQDSLATKVTIGAVDYDITEVEYNESISVTTTDNLLNTTSFDIAAPLYVNGTQLATQQQRSGNNSNVQCPFVWLVEPFVTNESRDVMSMVAAEPDLTLLFLDNMNHADWTTADHYANVIQPMDEIVEAFYEKLRTTRSIFGKVTSWRVIRHAIFGEYENKGHIKSIINEKTSGVEVRFSVEILKSLSCN